MKDAGNTKAHSMWREMAIFILLYVISIFCRSHGHGARASRIYSQQTGCGILV